MDYHGPRAPVRAVGAWALTWLLRWSRPRREFRVYPDDVVLVSYPRSGNTWVRFLVANLLSPDDPATFANIERKVPDVYKNTRRQLERVARPRVLKSHEYFDPRYKRVVYIVRDPRDVVVSYYHYHRKERMIEDGLPLARYVGRFVAGEVDPYGPWGDHVASWLATRHGRPEFLLVRYEDMLDEPVRALDRMASFLSIQRSPERLLQAVERSSAAHLRRLEDQQADQWVTTKRTRKDILFVRTATRGGWRSALPDDLVVQIESAWGPLMKALGYPLAISTAPAAGSSSGTGTGTSSVRGVWP